MEYKENALTYEMYYKLRKSVEWMDLPKTKIENSIINSLYTVTVFDGNCAIGMGRIIGDGIYYIIVDVYAYFRPCSVMIFLMVFLVSRCRG